MGGFQGRLHHADQILANRVQVDGILQLGRERGHGLVGVIPGPVEPPVHPPLHPAPHGCEQGRRGQGGGGHLIALSRPAGLVDYLVRA